MAKTLKFEYDGTEYTLEYTRKSIAEMEKRGFVAADVDSKPMTMLPALFAGAFIAHHRFVKKDTIDAIFDKLTKKDELLNKLSEMYSEPILSLVEEPKDSVGNVEWTASF